MTYKPQMPYMEFYSPVYELLFLYQLRGVKFPPYWDLMREVDIIRMIPKDDDI